jgi:hypothetical protein
LRKGKNENKKQGRKERKKRENFESKISRGKNGLRKPAHLRSTAFQEINLKVPKAETPTFFARQISGQT